MCVSTSLCDCSNYSEVSALSLCTNLKGFLLLPVLFQRSLWSGFSRTRRRAAVLTSQSQPPGSRWSPANEAKSSLPFGDDTLENNRLTCVVGAVKVKGFGLLWIIWTQKIQTGVQTCQKRRNLTYFCVDDINDAPPPKTHPDSCLMTNKFPEADSLAFLSMYTINLWHLL